MEFVPIKKNISKNKKKKDSFSSENEETNLTCKKSKRISKDASLEKVHGVASKNISSKVKPTKVVKKKSTLRYFTQDAADLVNDSVESVKPKRKKPVMKASIPRLFVLMQNKILNEEQVKALHPDIIAIRYPRKKRSRWCWAVFKSQESADQALKELKGRKDVKVTKPKFSKDDMKETIKESTKVESSKVKKAMKKKLKDAWL